MSERLVATLNVAFTENDGLGDNAGANKIILQQMTKRFDYKGRLWARCFPSSGVTFTASVGNVEGGEVRSEEVREGLKFSNSSKVELSKPGASNVSITQYVMMQKTKNIYGKTVIVPASVNLTYDQEQNAIIATAQGKEFAVYGGCSVRYQAPYKVLYYTPSVQRIGFTGGFAFHMGTIFGYNDYTVETLDMELDLSSSPDWVEYARVTSKIVLDAKGVWEFPPNWEQTYTNNKEKTGDQREDYSAPGQFPGFSAEIDEDNSFVDVRIHEIIEVNTTGTLRYLTQNGSDTIYAPYWGIMGSYHPKFEVKFNDPPGGAKASSAKDFQYDLNNYTWRDVFLSVNKAEVLEDLENTYPGVTEA